MIGRLFALQDLQYRDFQAKLMPTIDPETVIGVRTPALRKLAKQLTGTPEANAFLLQLPHQYYEENQLHGFLISGIRDFEQAIRATDGFLPYVDNWSTCDAALNPGVFKQHPAELLPHIRRWMADPHAYTVRFGIGMLMRHYLDDAFSPEQLDWVCAVNRDEYYIRMMVAWYMATALAKQYDAAIVCLQDHALDVWTHNKAIQKAIESYRITAEQKGYLKTLRR